MTDFDSIGKCTAVRGENAIKLIDIYDHHLQYDELLSGVINRVAGTSGS